MSVCSNPFIAGKIAFVFSSEKEKRGQVAPTRSSFDDDDLDFDF
jgi:hypothetical protein